MLWAIHKPMDDGNNELSGPGTSVPGWHAAGFGQRRARRGTYGPAAHSHVYEVTEPSSNDMKGGRHTNCPFGCVGRGRVGLVTGRLNLPRHGTAKGLAEKVESKPSQGCQPNPQAVA